MKKNHFRNICLFILISQIYALTPDRFLWNITPKTGRIKIQDKKGNLDS